MWATAEAYVAASLTLTSRPLHVAPLKAAGSHGHASSSRQQAVSNRELIDETLARVANRNARNRQTRRRVTSALLQGQNRHERFSLTSTEPVE